VIDSLGTIALLESRKSRGKRDGETICDKRVASVAKNSVNCRSSEAAWVIRASWKNYMTQGNLKNGGTEKNPGCI